MNSVLNSFQSIHRELGKACYVDLATFQENFTEGTEVERNIRERISRLPEADQGRIVEEYFGLGPLASLVDREDLTEIIINGRGAIWYEQHGKFYLHNDSFFSDVTFRNFIHRLCKESGIFVNLDHPFADGQWRRFRIHIVGKPIVKEEYVLNFRFHPQRIWTLDRLIERDWCSPAAGSLLRTLLKNRENFLIVGATGVGKTTVVNALLSEVVAHERMVIVEDVDEIHCPNSLSTKLITRRDVQRILGDIDQTELVRQSLRMRPDRIVMGEIRGAEAKDFLMALATGHSGSLGTLHAESARQALIRLEMLIQMGAPQWSLAAVRTLIALSLKYIVVLSRSHEGQRSLEGVYRLASLEECGFLLESVTK